MIALRKRQRVQRERNAHRDLWGSSWASGPWRLETSRWNALGPGARGVSLSARLNSVRELPPAGP